jgi:hypothetical protein
MGRPYRPVRELEAHLERGELDFAIAIAKAVARERRQPLELGVMLRFLPLVATRRPDTYDEWSLRWLERWCAELRGSATIDEAAEVVAALAEIPVDPEGGVRAVRETFGRHGSGRRGRQ